MNQRTRPTIGGGRLEDSAGEATPGAGGEVYATAALGLGLLRSDGSILDMNPAGALMLGYSRQELRRLTNWDITHPDHRWQSPWAPPDGEGNLPPHHRLRTRLLRKNGLGLETEVTFSPLLDPEGRLRAVVMGFVEQESRQREERRRLDAQSLEAARQTAGAICHELNQPLQVLTGHLEMLMLSMPADSPTQKNLLVMMSEVTRMAETVRRLMDLNRFRTKPYLSGKSILDLDLSAGEDLA